MRNCWRICPGEDSDSARLLLRSHSQLADIAEGLHDAYSEHLHRGIGHYLMARHFKGISVGGTVVSSEALLAKAQAELTQAIEMRPMRPDPSWYLYGVHIALGHKQVAESFLALGPELGARAALSAQGAARHRVGRATACRQRPAAVR